MEWTPLLLQGSRLLLIALVAPAAGALNTDAPHLYALGATAGWHEGVGGVQFGRDDAVGARYWLNESEDGTSGTLILTTCYTPSPGWGVYCARHKLTA